MFLQRPRRVFNLNSLQWIWISCAAGVQNTTANGSFLMTDLLSALTEERARARLKRIN